jgi:hypothetical protein
MLDPIPSNVRQIPLRLQTDLGLPERGIPQIKDREAVTYQGPYAATPFPIATLLTSFHLPTGPFGRSTTASHLGEASAAKVSMASRVRGRMTISNGRGAVLTVTDAAGLIEEIRTRRGCTMRIIEEPSRLQDKAKNAIASTLITSGARDLGPGAMGLGPILSDTGAARGGCHRA